MTDQLTIWQEIWRGVLASGAVTGVITTAAWGAAGGATSALAVEVPARSALRQIALGALVAGGSGSFATAGVVVGMRWLTGADVPPDLIPAIGAGASASYFAGVFGPAIIEMILRRIMGRRPPGGSEGDADG
ncbi:hypothetical protein [Pseudogemmobacter bohemicus]|uniref:hypothetical protein n=1 Tax=Pseudogemmobacter bohemicus TaxID=2250708 RepID=UPI000DD4D5D1|nr:hypothetical protein [Pseudogemmobacter bohemicus]